MPRLTKPDYLKTHRELRCFWLNRPGMFANLQSQEQWHLHDYFQPSKDLSDTELLAHRKVISKQRPSLPHQAGRALSRFFSQAAQPVRVPVAVPKGKRATRGQITIRAVVRPEIDIKRFARAITGLRQAKLRKQIEQTDALIRELDDWIEEQLDQAS